MQNNKTKALRDSVEHYKSISNKEIDQPKTLKEALLLIKQTSNEEHIRIIANKALRLDK